MPNRQICCGSSVQLMVDAVRLDGYVTIEILKFADTLEAGATDCEERFAGLVAVAWIDGVDCVPPGLPQLPALWPCT